MLIIGIVIAAGLVIVGAVVVLLIREERRLRQAEERARRSHRAAATVYGWRIIDDERGPAQPDTVRRSMRGPGGSQAWMLARRRIDGVDVWVVCREGMGMGAEAHHSLVVHLRPMRRAKDLPAVRVVPRSPAMGVALRGRDLFDRRYRIASRETTRARTLVTEEVRTQTLELDLEGWQLQDRILTVLFAGLRDPGPLEDRLGGLIRLAKQVAGPPPGAG
ncbi:hypothetical protein AB0E67_35125 [Streptomyces sp. NPDC032161]|uniref:hypothetical protein n=1 Tax=unclassified Streptomyces TaxID=2593676 RepID=UPI0033E38CFD